jgi:hypothetical protein
MTAVTLVILGSFVLWQVRPGGEPPTPSTGRGAPVGRVHDGATAAGAQAVGPAEALQGRSSYRTDTSDTLDETLAHLSATPAGPTRYLVASSERARALTALGLVADETVMVVSADEDAAQVQASVAQRGATVIDMRLPADVPSAACGTDRHQPAC